MKSVGLKRILDKIKGYLKEKNELIPLLLFTSLTFLVSIIYNYAPDLLRTLDDNPYATYYNMDEIHKIILKIMMYGSFVSMIVLVMWVVFPGSWTRLESVMRDKDYEPKWIRDLFIFCFFVASLLALVFI